MQPGISALAGNDRRWLVIAAVVLLAIVVGLSFAGANWILIAALLAIPILLIRPREICLGCYAFLLPYDSISSVGPAGQTLTFIAGAAVLAVLLGTTLVKKDLQRPPRQALWWTLFVVWAGTTSLWALDWEVASSRIVTAVSLLVLFLVVLSANLSRKELKTVSMFAVAGAAIASIYTIRQFFGGGLNYHDEIRGSLMAGSKATDPNAFAASLLLPLSLATTGFLAPGRWLTRLAWLAVTATIGLGILVTGSRGAMVAVAVMIVFYIYTRQVSRLMTIPLVASFVALLFLMPAAFFTRMASTADSGGAGRTVVWQGGLVAFERYPLIGAGLNNFPLAYRENVGSAPLYHGSYVSGAHNTYLEIAVELGLVGLILLVTAAVAQLRAASRMRKNVSKKTGSFLVAYEAGCYGILMAALFLGVIWEKWFWLGWMFLGVAVATARAEKPVAAPAAASKPSIWPWEDVQIRSTPGAHLR